MKTIKEAANHSGIPEKLIRAVVRQIGGIEAAKQYFPDIVNHGIDAGFPGFTYYSDTVSFFKRHRKNIIEVARVMADCLGENIIDMVANFNCLRPVDYETRDEIGRAVYGGPLGDKDYLVANALSWFIGEEVARVMCDE